MIDTTRIFAAGSSRGQVNTNPESAIIGTINLRSNDAYEKVLGFNFGIKNTSKLVVGSETTYVENSTPYVGGARVSITDANGKIILPMMPFELVKHSEQQQFVDRFIEIKDIPGHSCDIFVRFEFPPTPKVNNEVVVYMVDATALYSKRG